MGAGEGGECYLRKVEGKRRYDSLGADAVSDGGRSLELLCRSTVSDLQFLEVLVNLDFLIDVGDLEVVEEVKDGLVVKEIVVNYMESVSKLSMVKSITEVE